MTASRFTWLLLLTVGCYDAREVGTSDVVQIDAPAESTADGQTLVEIAILVDARTKSDTVIDVEVSQGAIALGAEPGSDDSRKLSLRNLAGGRLALQWRPGNEPGDAVITASVGGQLASHVVELGRSRAQEVALEASTSSVVADGETSLDLTAWLSAEAGGGKDSALPLVSVGEKVSFHVCCVLSSKLADCESASPLRVPPMARLKTDQSVTVRAVSDRIPGVEGDPAQTVAVIATVDDATFACKDYQGTDEARVDVMVRPVLPAPE